MKKTLSLILAIVMIAITLASCANTSYIATFDGKKINVNLYVALLSQSKYGIESSASEQGMTLEQVWGTKPSGSGETYDQQLQKSAVDVVINYQVVEALLKKNNITFTDTDRQQTIDYLTQSVEAYGGRAQIESNLRNYNMSYTDYEEFQINASKQAKLFEYYYAEKGVNAVPTTEIRAYAEKTYARVKQILIATTDLETGQPLAEDKLNEKKAQADDLFNKSKVSDAEFVKLVNEKSEDPGSKTYPEGYIFNAQGIPFGGGQAYMKEFVDGTFGLQNNAISMVKTDYGYHIIKRYPLFENDTKFEEAKFTFLSDYKALDFQKILGDEKVQHKIVINDAALKKYDVKTLKIGAEAAAQSPIK